MRRILRWLWEVHGAPKLDGYIRSYSGVRPRNVTATREEIDTLLDAANPGMRLWLLLCSDLAIRSGTAARIGASHYDKEQRQLRFTTKHDARQTLPVTQEIQDLIEQCDLTDPAPFVKQLWTLGVYRGGRPLMDTFGDGNSLRRAFTRFRISLGITRRITPHDLRRTTAVAMYKHSGDLRAVQALLGHANLNSTLHYLDHDLRPIERSTLEILKRPAWRKDHIA